MSTNQGTEKDLLVQYRIFFIKLGLLAILPVVIVMVSFLVWELIYCIERHINSKKKHARYEDIKNGSMTKSFYVAGVVKVSPQDDSERVRSQDPDIS